MTVGLGFSIHLGLLFCHCVPVSFAFVVLDLVSSVLSQETGGWDGKNVSVYSVAYIPRILFRRI